MAKRETQRAARREIWHPADYDIPDVRAVQHLFTLAMTDQLVDRALRWIIESCCQTYDNGTAGSLAANDPHGRISAFVDGRRFAGQQIVKLAKLKISAIDPDAPQNEEGVGPEPAKISESREL